MCQLRSGDVISGRYVLEQRLGLGGMGEVWLAELQGAGAFRRRVVLKVLAPERRGDSRLAAMLADEARVVGLLHHRAIVGALDYLESAEHGPVLVLEYVDGASLRTVLEIARRRNVFMPESLAAHAGGQVARALHAAHTALGSDGQPLRLVHRDVAPDNVLLSRSGEVFLGDFGVARAEGNAETTEPGVLPKGKRGYMAPEQALGRAVSPQSDIFSLGRVIAEAADVNLGLDLRAVLEKATAERPQDRYATAQDFALALQAACPPPADPESALASWLLGAAPEALHHHKTSPGAAPRREEAPASKAASHPPGSDPGQPLPSLPRPSRRALRVAAACAALIFVALPLVLMLPALRHAPLLDPAAASPTLRAALPGAPAASQGALRVTSRPGEAEVYLDGRLRGLTPLRLDLAAGKHSVRVGSPRLEHWRAAEVNVRGDTEHLLDVDLSE